jgi:glycosyltransferase involved in cell wall biosynthesis
MPVFMRQQSGTVAAQSVLAQTGTDLELIIVDDSSPDPFVLNAELAADPRVRLVRSVQNGGAAAARNTGIEQAGGEFLAFIDSDDVWHASKLRTQFQWLEQQSPNSLAGRYCLASGYTRVDLRSGARVNLIPRAGNSLADFASGCWFCPGSTLLIRRAVFNEVGTFDANLRRLEDLDWFLRFGRLGGRVLIVPEVLADINVGPKSRPEAIKTASAYLSEKWLRGGSSTRLDPGERRRLTSYLHLEKAAAHLDNRDFMRFGASFLTSLVLVPRTRVHLQQWWDHPKP